MRANVRHGKIPEPKSLQAAIDRHKQVLFELRKVEGQLADADRASKMRAYDVWRARAEHVARLFRSEKTQLAAWIETHNADGETLFRRAYDMLKSMEEDDVDFFEPEELELMKALDAHFDAKEVRKTG